MFIEFIIALFILLDQFSSISFVSVVAFYVRRLKYALNIQIFIHT